jgi:hypothetical protein
VAQKLTEIPSFAPNVVVLNNTHKQQKENGEKSPFF